MQSLYQRCYSLTLTCLLLLTALAACAETVNTPPPPAATPTPRGGTVNSIHTMAGGGTCVQNPKAPYANILVSQDSYIGHSESMLAQNPANPLQLVGGSKFFTDLARYRFQIGYYSSSDGGCTWSKGDLLPGFEPDDLVSDPVFAYGPDNRAYAAVLFAGGPKSGIAISTSTDNGKTFAPPVTVFVDNTGASFSDKPWMTVDMTNSPYRGSIYVAWSYDHRGECGRGNFCSEQLAFSRSTDGGKTFSEVKMVEGSAPFCTNRATNKPEGATTCDAVQGVTPVVAPDGTLYIVTPYIDVMDSGNVPTRLIMVSSPDGGTTWTAPTLVATIHDIVGVFPPDRYRNISLPGFTSDPRTGQLYVVWADKSTGDADILLTTSKDSGKTWSTPKRINDDQIGNKVNQFQPQIAVAPNGVVSVSFFDTRIDGRHRLIDVFLTQSVDGGTTFLKNVRVTTESWNPVVGVAIDRSGLHFIGDYQGLSADNQFVHPFWNDTRTGRQDIFTAAIPSAQPGSPSSAKTYQPDLTPS